MSCYHLELSPVDLESLWYVVTWSKSVVDLIKIEQSLAELFISWQILPLLRHAVTLTFDPLTLNFCCASGVMCPNPSCIKFERNRTIYGRVINDLAYFRRQIFHRSPNPRTVPGVRGPNFIRLGEDTVRSSLR